MLFISAFFKNESIKTTERKVRQSKQQFMIQAINFNCVYGKAVLEEMLGGKKKSRKHKINVRIQKVDQIKDDFRLWAQVTGTTVMLSVVIWKGGNEKEIKSSVLAILNLSCREDSPEEIKETNRFFLGLLWNSTPLEQIYKNDQLLGYLKFQI